MRRLTGRDIERAVTPGSIAMGGGDRIRYRGKWIAQFMPEHREKLIFALVGVLELIESFPELIFKLDTLGHVANKASRVEELSVLPVTAGVDENLAGRAVFASERGGK